MGYTSFSLFEEDVFFATAVFGAYLNSDGKGFEVSNIRFLLNVFVNWVAPTAHHRQVSLTDAAIERYLKLLIEEGFAKKLTRKSPIKYRLSSEGVLELPRRLIRRSYHCQPDEFFFVYSFLEKYSPTILKMMKDESSGYPFETVLEIEALLEFDSLIDRQIEISERELITLHQRLGILEETENLIGKLSEQDLGKKEIIQQLESDLPLSLHSMIPLSTFNSELGSDDLVWELLTSLESRKSLMWDFQLQRIEQFIEQLELLRKRSKRTKRG